MPISPTPGPSPTPRTGDVVAIDFGASGVPLGHIYTIVSLTDDELTMFDEGGRFLFLTRRDPGDEFACDPIEPVARFTDLPKPLTGTSSDLEFDGTHLYYADETSGDVAKIDAATGAPSPEISLSPNAIVAAQLADFWVSCNCGGNTDIDRRTIAGGSVDTVAPGALGQPLNIQAVAVDPSDANLILYGTRAPDGIPFLIEINASNEPDVVVTATQLESEFSFLPSLAHDGTSLWTIASAVRGVLVRLDPATLAVTGVFQLPELETRWHAVAVGGGRMFLLGVDEDDAGVIIEVTPPDA